MARMRSEDRRRQLLEVSAELFAQSGYRGTTTAELAKAASVTEPILYRHFNNKLDLFVSPTRFVNSLVTHPTHTPDGFLDLLRNIRRYKGEGALVFIRIKDINKHLYLSEILIIKVKQLARASGFIWG